MLFRILNRSVSLLKPPDIMGVWTYSKSHRTFNTVRRDASGEFASTSLVSTYKLTTIEYSSRSFVPCRLGTDRCDFTNRSRNAEWLLPARLAHWPEPPRRSLDRTDTGRSALVAGTGLHAPQPTLNGFARRRSLKGWTCALTNNRQFDILTHAPGERCDEFSDGKSSAISVCAKQLRRGVLNAALVSQLQLAGLGAHAEPRSGAPA